MPQAYDMVCKRKEHDRKCRHLQHEWKKLQWQTEDLYGLDCTACDAMDTLEYWEADNGDWKIQCGECGHIHDEGSA